MLPLGPAEVHELVGGLRTPIYAGDAVTWRPCRPPPEPPDDDDDVTPVIETRGADGPWAQVAVDRDPQLGYFLTAGAVVEAWQGGDSTDVGAP